MSTIYKFECSNCGELAAMDSTDLALQMEDGTLVHLPDRGRDIELEKICTTEVEAYAQARMVSVHNSFCLNCGRCCEAYSFSRPFSCIFMLMVCLIGLMTFGLVMMALLHFLEPPRNPVRQRIVVTALVTGIGVLTCLLYFFHRAVTRSFRKHLPFRPPLKQMKCCDACSPDSHLVPSGYLVGKKFVCPKCKAQSLTINDSWIT